MRDLIGITYDAGSSGPELTAAEWRQVETGLFLRNASDLVVTGVRGGAVSNTGFSVTIAPLTAVVQSSAANGVYQAAFPAGAAELAKTITAAHATLPRVDALDVKIFDTEADASTFRGADIQLNAGTAAGSPSAPAFAGVGVRLGTYAVPASGGGNPVFTPNPALIGYAGPGGVLDVATRPSNVRAGTEIYNRSTGAREIYHGGSWRNLATTDWVAWTTDWRAPGGSVAHGTGGGAEKTALYKDLGNEVRFKIRIKRGTSGTSVGDGAYTWSLPTGMDATTFDSDTGVGYYTKAANPTDRVPLIWATVNTTAIGAWRTYDAQRLAFDTGGGWAAGDIIILNGSYQKTPA